MDDGESRIEVALGTRGTQDPVFAEILEGQCKRSDYDGRAVPAADRAALKTAARIEGVEVILIEGRTLIEQVQERVDGCLCPGFLEKAKKGVPLTLCEQVQWARNEGHSPGHQASRTEQLGFSVAGRVDVGRGEN